MPLDDAGEAAARARGAQLPPRRRRARRSTFRARVSATHRDLDAAVAAGRFRQDLLYRLDALPLLGAAAARAPRGRGWLWGRFFQAAAAPARARRRRSVRRRGALAAHPWPGNVRELRNRVDRAVALRPNFDSVRCRSLFPRAEASHHPREEAGQPLHEVRDAARATPGIPARDVSRPAAG